MIGGKFSDFWRGEATGGFLSKSQQPRRYQAPPDRFGPSSLIISHTKPRKASYEANLWIGGEGYELNEDGEKYEGAWGVNIQLTVEAARGLDKHSLRESLTKTLESYRAQLTNQFDAASAQVIIHAVRNVALGHSYDRGYSAAEVLAYDAAL